LIDDQLVRWHQQASTAHRATDVLWTSHVYRFQTRQRVIEVPEGIYIQKTILGHTPTLTRRWVLQHGVEVVLIFTYGHMSVDVVGFSTLEAFTYTS